MYGKEDFARKVSSIIMSAPAAAPPTPKDRIEEAVRRGILIRYDPAWKHHGEAPSVVTCSQCGAAGLEVCMGMDDADLCLPCMDIIRAGLATVRVGSNAVVLRLPPI